MSPARVCLLFVLLGLVGISASRLSPLLLKESLSKEVQEKEFKDLYDEVYDSEVEVDDSLSGGVTDEPETKPTTENSTDFTVLPTTGTSTDNTVTPTTEDSTDFTVLPTTGTPTDNTVIPTTEDSTDFSVTPTTEDSTDSSSDIQTEFSTSYSSDATDSATSTASFASTSTTTTSKPTSTSTIASGTTSAEPTTSPAPGTTTTQVPSLDYRRVHIDGLGTARGKILRSFLGREFYGFMSIPYALPPVGERRFKYPEPWEGEWPKEEDGEYDSTWLRARCPQISMLFDVIAGKEDCLHLTIYTPLLPEDMQEGADGLPVMFWIHGGAYMSGDANLYVPTKLMDRDVVVVVVQYRLGLLGFLSGGVPDAPGNMGIMDQITGLRWVQDYIHHFGGNPDLVTVFGQSAGGASASWMQVTPLTNASAPGNKGRQLLHRVIPQSGSALELWTIDKNPEESFKVAAWHLNCWGQEETTEQMLSCMRAKTYQEVERAALTIYADDRKNGGLGFRGLCPVVQSGLVEEDMEVVIPEDPRASLARGQFLKVPILTGSVRDEGSLVVGLTYKDYMDPNNHTINDTDFMRDEALHQLINAFGIDDKNGAVTDSMQVAYLPNAVMGEWDTMIGGMIDMCGVLFLKSGLWEMVHYTYKAAPHNLAFFYSWEYEADDSLFKWMFFSMPHVPVPGGISHADELIYLFHLPGDMDEQQREMVRRMITLWTNFAKYGNPTPYDVDKPEEAWQKDMPTWRPFSIREPNFMLMADNFTMELDFMTRWNYHRDIGQTTTEPPVTTPEPQVSWKKYDHLLHEKQTFEIITGVLGGVCCCMVLLSIFLVAKLSKKRGIKA